MVDRRVLKLVDGLKARPALNGAVVEVQSYDSASGRHVVLTADLESLKLKPSNLLDFADAPPSLLSDARDRGTAAYKARRFHEAVEWYTLAAKADGKDARPLSNRAAAHLEASADDCNFDEQASSLHCKRLQEEDAAQCACWIDGGSGGTGHFEVARAWEDDTALDDVIGDYGKERTGGR